MASAVADFHIGMSLPFVLQCQLADLGLHILHTGTLRLALLCRAQEYPHRPVQQLRLPLQDLAGMHIKLLGELRQRLVALKRG